MNIKVAIVQSENLYNHLQQNIVKMELQIKEAANKGAQIVVFPELSACGYIPNQSIWKYAEELGGNLTKWCCDLSKKLEIYIGVGFIEKKDNHFYNSYILAGTEGEICGVIRKESAESYCFSREKGDLSVVTKFGKIGIGICADNHYFKRLKRMKKESINFMLMPHASPAPFRTTNQISQKDFEHFQEQPYLVASVYSNYLGVPTVYVNAVGTYPEFSGGKWVRTFNEDFCLRGGSLAVDKSGGIIDKLGDKEELRIVELTIGENLNQGQIDYKPHVYHFNWLHPGNGLYRILIMPLVTFAGIIQYRRSRNK